ncbi:MAG: T9SS type A sorting domain-containing protein [Chitinophagaceae bacterium]|nr:T9SS type A sorting domain-containing protein [Chitinophagaceae bacterium]
MKHILPLLISTLFFYNAKAQALVPVIVNNFSFTPPNLVINQGDMVEWTNAGGFHNINGTTAVFPTNPEDIFSGAPAGAPWVFSKTFTLTGTYSYLCDVHGINMSGTITVNGPLPIELQYINVAVNKGICKIEWKTDKEENLANFVLQRSSNAIDFTDVTTVSANHMPSVYNYFDDMGTHPFVYYRVKITDENNLVKYTPVRLAQNDIKITKNTLNLLPNPYVDHFHISMQSVGNWAGVVAVYDFTGRTLYKEKHNFAEGNNYIHLENSGSYPKGLYIVSVRNVNNIEYMSATVVKE